MLLKKMTDRLTANRSTKPVQGPSSPVQSSGDQPASAFNSSTTPSTPTQMSSTPSVSMSMSISSSKGAHSSLSTVATSSQTELRGSISTPRTSVSDWTNNHRKQEPMEVYEIPHALQLQVRRPKGSYRLSDFIIHRTLGTGSFGRVHLG